MTPSVSTLQRLTRTMHERWETLGPETLDSIRDAEGVPHEAVSAAVSLDGVMVPLRAGEDGRAEASWREAACGTVSFHDARGERLKTLYLGHMPESGKVTLKAQLASEVAHIRQLRPDVRIVAIADGGADNWTFLETLSPETEVIDFWHACEHLRTASDHAVASDWFERCREVLRHDPVFEAVSEALANGEEVRIVGIGTFGTRHRPARTGRNPRPGVSLATARARILCVAGRAELPSPTSANETHPHPDSPDHRYRSLVMPTIPTRIPYAIAIALVTIWVTNATASDRLAKQPGFLYVASFNVYKLGGVKKRYTKLKDVENPELPLGGNIPKRHGRGRYQVGRRYQPSRSAR